MINKVFKYIEYPTKRKIKYSNKSFDHLMQNKITLPLTKNGKNFYFYNSSTLQSCMIDMKKLLVSFDISNKNMNFFHFNELKSTLAIEGEEFSINQISKGIKNKEGIVNSINNSYINWMSNTEISKASLIKAFIDMQSYKRKFESDYRKEDVFITDGIHFVPREKPKNIKNRMIELFDFINNSKLDPILIAFLSHYIYEEIHPFYDFNGRTGRLLMNIILLNKTKSSIPFLSSSINTFRKKYYKSFEEVDKGYDLTYFVFNLINILYKYILAFKEASKYNLSPSLTELLIKIFILNKKEFSIYELKSELNQSDKRAALHEKMKQLVDKKIIGVKIGHTKQYYLKSGKI